MTAGPRTFGVEEEYFFLHGDALTPAPVGARVRDEFAGVGRTSAFVAHEFLEAQIERSTPVFRRLSEAAADLATFRSRLARAAEAHGVVVASVGTPFMTDGWPAITSDPRYHRVQDDFRGLVTDHLISGTHVHVGIDSPDEGIIALNGLRAWLPPLLALLGNSPYWRGADTGFASWRAVHMRRWTTVGAPPVFRDAGDYRDRIDRLVGIGGISDTKMVWWVARLAEFHPTVEVRLADAQLDVDSTLLYAALVRALVDTAVQDARDGRAPLEVPPELLDAALWHAARDGVGGTLLDPRDGLMHPADDVVDALLAAVDDALTANGDREAVHRVVARIRLEGTGAQRQRQAVRTGGRGALRELYRSALVERRATGE
ncbi:glutamate--cysteine ligase [Curtobacterium sp. ISL-83]|uniref:carboxylate-amine ligase n=1 Tax=Curtobacterium sp. ISL-83 TaxID=2819145 RepID=UPI001BEB976F|nr:glutamate--cysteine ligase [Curtobacterium sp. ISL-83]MBT2503439.1 glutamate--cysteine ligase [Curtobacterium sp. ISL-83]